MTIPMWTLWLTPSGIGTAAQLTSERSFSNSLKNSSARPHTNALSGVLPSGCAAAHFVGDACRNRMQCITGPRHLWHTAIKKEKFVAGIMAWRSLAHFPVLCWCALVDSMHVPSVMSDWEASSWRKRLATGTAADSQPGGSVSAIGHQEQLFFAQLSISRNTATTWRSPVASSTGLANKCSSTASTAPQRPEIHHGGIFFAY